jgi:hypothetical protein
MVKGVLLGDVFACLADDNRQLSFVIALVVLSQFWNCNILAEGSDTGAWFNEDGWIWRWVTSSFSDWVVSAHQRFKAGIVFTHCV